MNNITEEYYETENLKAKKRINMGLLSTVLTLITLIVFVFIIVISYKVNQSYNDVRSSINRFVICEQSSDTIKTSSNELTELARMFVVNHDERFALAYVEELEENNAQQKALEDLKRFCSDKEIALQRLEVAISQSKSLTAMELYNMRLCYEIFNKNTDEIPELIRKIEIKPSERNLSHEELHEQAVKNMFGNGYLIYKMRVNDNCLITIKAISDEIKQEVDLNAEILGRNLDRLRIFILILLVINALSTIGLKEFRDVTKSYNKMYEMGERQNRILLKNAEYDALTGILNRRAYEQICSSSAKQKISIALLLIDMDNFKHINDTYGHTGGDSALKALASILRDTFRNEDYVCRIGGDEFAAVLVNFKPEGFKIVQEKIASVNERLSQIEGLADVSVSVGIAFSSTGYTEELYKKADKALYSIKESGKKGC
ncbi:MAG: GGDEF domain-containing protein, partial [Treponema sp.]|nr:GGDEF domain-containing protein [Treponema sp.]